MGLVLLILLVLLLVGGLPAWGWHSYGYGPSGILFIVLVVILVVYLVRGRV